MVCRIKRAYEPSSPNDGTRILVDRLWPRGLSKADARIDLWLKDVAPSTALRLWFGHEPAKWHEFRSRYRAELHAKGDLMASIKEKAGHGTVTLLYAAKDEEHNNAVVLLEQLAHL